MPSLTTNRSEFQAALADWYARAQRPLPWRTGSAYRTVVSELMAQQTQIRTMLPYFERWMARFPDFETWRRLRARKYQALGGLGYYSRARNLHKLAGEYVALEPKPSTRDAWQALPASAPTALLQSADREGYPAAGGRQCGAHSGKAGPGRALPPQRRGSEGLTPLADAVLNTATGRPQSAMMNRGNRLPEGKPLCTVCPVVGSAQLQPVALRPSYPK